MNTMTKSSGKTIGFVQIEKKGLITILCRDCSQHFGLDPQFVENVSELVFQYTCPYCGRKHMLRND